MFEKQVSALCQGSLFKHVQKTDPSWRNGLRLSQKEVAQVQASEAEKLKALEAMGGQISPGPDAKISEGW